MTAVIATYARKRLDQSQQTSDRDETRQQWTVFETWRIPVAVPATDSGVIAVRIPINPEQIGHLSPHNDDLSAPEAPVARR